MIELRTLGEIDLRHADGTRMQAVLAQPRRLALLVYLVKAGRGPAPTFHRRDALLAMFWPDAEDGRARDALKVAVHFLRRALGRGVLIGRGAGELGVAADAISCDAAAFEHATDQKKPDEAVTLYRGDFLAAFHISGAPGFEEWMESERARLSARYRQMLEGLARAGGESEDADGTAALWRRVVDTAPLDTKAVIALMRALDRKGDRAGALLAAREHERRVRVELDADVDPSLRALETEIRRKRDPEATADLSVAPSVMAANGHGAAGNSLGSPNAPSDGDAAMADRSYVASAKYTGSRPELGRWMNAIGRRAVVAAAVVVATATATTATLVSSREPSPAAPLRRERVLVAPLENRTGDSSVDALGEMAADWIAQGLQETGLAEVVDPMSAITSRHRAEDDVLRLSGLARAGALARVAGAGSVVWGAVYRSGDSLVFRAQVSDVAAGQVRIALEPVSTSAADPRKGVEQLRTQVAGALAAMLDRRVASVTDPTSRPPTLEAYIEYALGLETFQRGGSGYKESIPHFAAASRLDTTFMTPRVWLVFAYGSEQTEQSDSMVAVLAAHRGTLARLDRYALEFFEAQKRNDEGATLTAAREAARLSPGSEWSYNAGTLLLNKGRPREALLYLQQIDPEHGWARQWTDYWAALARGHHWLGDYRKELAAAERLRTLSPESRSGRYLLARALMSGGQIDAAEQQAHVLLEAAAPDESPVMLTALLAHEFAGHGYAAAARRLYQSAADWPRTPAGAAWVEGRSRNDAMRRALEADIAIANYELGRWGEVSDGLLAADTADMDLRLLGTLVAVRQGDRSAAGKFTRVLDDANARGSLPDADYYRARLAAVLGDKEAAVRDLRALWAAGFRSYGFEVHRESDFQSLRDDPRLKLLMRPSE